MGGEVAGEFVRKTWCISCSAITARFVECSSHFNSSGEKKIIRSHLSRVGDRLLFRRTELDFERVGE